MREARETTVEAVARAMLAAERCTAIGDEYWSILWNDPTSMTAFRLKSQAIAAIDAHLTALSSAGIKVLGREPTDAMSFDGMTTTITTQQAIECWECMWDAALPPLASGGG